MALGGVLQPANAHAARAAASKLARVIRIFVMRGPFVGKFTDAFSHDRQSEFMFQVKKRHSNERFSNHEGAIKERSFVQLSRRTTMCRSDSRFARLAFDVEHRSTGATPVKQAMQRVGRLAVD